MELSDDGGAARVDADRLRQVLGAPQLDWLVQRIRQRMESGRPLTGPVSVPDATEEQWAAVRHLLGRSPRSGRSLTVNLVAVDEVLRRSGVSPAGLGPAVEALTGPVPTPGGGEDALARAWHDAYTPLSTACAQRPDLAEWFDRLVVSGLVRRVAGDVESAAPLLRMLAAVVAELPSNGEPVRAFAERVCGDPGALDDDRALTTLTLGAVRALTDVGIGSGSQWKREVWASAGLLKDDLDSTVVTLGLPGDTETATGRALRALTAAGQPAVLTLRQLVRDAPLPLPAGTPVHVCQNTAVLAAAADRLGARSRPLVCAQGQPGAAAMTLLRHLLGGGAELRYHGDFDWAGIRIANVLHRRLPWSPWRYAAADYRQAITAVNSGRLNGNAVTADWDRALTDSMALTGYGIGEEQLLDGLLADLRTD
ncbi:uncharacterized protein (TIGR02679 family) [Murinocardiopsis flavida]|uniref:Uncharacterized protein (TIGR02679 family) n=1 Tax=Murinocardiopsis flavida TaxID=645275 RepID=A0A2P8CUV7_9ACTN|nr:uncharacterized protein (TIGR02679 family) [Murinocardiopsis flavida]